MRGRPSSNAWLALVTRAGIVCAAGVTGGSVSAQTVAPLPRETLSWNGDVKVPDVSGVWVRDDTSSTSAGSREGWLPWPPPLKPAFAAKWQKRVADAANGTRTDDPVSGCQPPGMPRFMTGSTKPLLILQTPGRVMLYRDGSPVRRVWLDGRPQPAAKDLENFYNGNSMGRFVGSDLVTDVRGFKDLPIDATGVPHSDDLKIVERIRRVAPDTLRVEVTLTDSTAYLRPMTSVVTYKSGDPAWEPGEFICTPQKDYHPELYVR